MISNFREVVAELKSQVPIQELISEYLTLKKSGRGFVALCPFHDDHNPSLQIHPQKGIFKCFSCGTGGDVITFYSLINKQKWFDAVVELANKYGVKLEYGEENKAEVQIKSKLFEINKLAAGFFQNNLNSPDGKDALNYIKNERKLTDETIKKYEIGFALDRWDSLYNFLSKEKQFAQELIIASGLLIPKENDSSYYDRFRNRIIFPIFNERNQILGFGGRILPGTSKETAKYINSPETLIFNKGFNVYGLGFAKDEIKAKDAAILTEGYLDVISAHQYGLKNTVATLGTAITQNQIRLLAKYTTSKRIYMCMDTDAAGKKAIENIFRLTQDSKEFAHIDLRVVTKLPAKDLDESLRLKPADEITQTIEAGEKILDFILSKSAIDYKTSVKNNDGITRKYILDDTISILTAIKDPIEQKEYIQKAAYKLNIEEEIFNLKIREKQKERFRKSRLFKRQTTSKTDDTELMFRMYSDERFRHAETELLLLYISSFPHTKDIRDKLLNLEFLDDKHMLIKEYLDNLDEENITPFDVINKLTLEFNEYKHIMAVISELAFKLESDTSIIEEHYSKNKDTILLQAKEWITWWITNKQKMKSLTTKLKDCTNRNEESDILSQMMELIKETRNKK